MEREVVYLTGSERADLLEMLENYFGIPRQVFDAYHLIRQSKKYVSIVSADHDPPNLPVASMGIPFVRTNLKYPKLTSAAAMMFGRYATRNLVSLSRIESEAFVRREDLVLDDYQLIATVRTGYVIAQHDGVPLGLGLVVAEGTEMRLKSLYPGGWSPATRA